MAGIVIDTSTVNQAYDPNQSKSKSSLDKDAFMKLLVAQMQYQDPLEPTSNTEYMAQLAQFSTVEELQNLSTSFATGQSMNMAGQYVIMNVPDASGEMKQVTGLVDYVTLKEGKAFFHINDDYYPADCLDSVVSLDYLEHLASGASNSDYIVQTSEMNQNAQEGAANQSEGSEEV